MMKTVIVLGDLNIDIILSGIEKYPSPGREILAEEHVVKAGGSAANVASMLAVNGCPVQLFSQAGSDSFGRYAVESLKKYGINTDKITFSKKDATGITVSLTYPDDRIYITHTGTVASTRLEDIKNGYISRGSHLHLASYFLQKKLRPSIGRLLERAKMAGMSTSLDPGGDPSGEWDISGLVEYLQYLDWFLPNADEIKGITGTGDIHRAVRDFHYVMGLVVKTGPEGAITRYEGEIRHHAGYTVKITDTTCAGDCFDAGFLYGITTGRSLSEAVDIGNKFGAHAVSCTGLPPKRIIPDHKTNKG
ncbi:MAG: carbohydrate kinase family protein [Spirochaetes bacterium]|nr:carbohydrate kinase family protein [Spirochaetota bacterium]